MAQGDFTLFQEVAAACSNSMDFDADLLKLALVTSAVTPAAGDVTPALADYTEVATGGNYAAGGTDVVATFTETGGLATLNGTDVTWLQHASNPTDARWAILYDDTTGTDECIGFFDLGAVTDMTLGNLTVAFHASGIATFTI